MVFKLFDKYLVVSPAEENSKEKREKAETAADDAGDHAEVLLQVQQDDPVLRLGRLEVLHVLATWLQKIVQDTLLIGPDHLNLEEHLGDPAEVLLQVQQDDPVLRLGGLEVLHILATWVRGIVSLLPSILIFISVSICFLGLGCFLFFDLVVGRLLLSLTTRQDVVFSHPQETWVQE